VTHSLYDLVLAVGFLVIAVGGLLFCGAVAYSTYWEARKTRLQVRLQEKELKEGQPFPQPSRFSENSSIGRFPWKGMQ
jgi:hypothetical protein